MAKGRRTFGLSKKEKEFALFFGHNFKRSKKSRDVDNGTTKGLTNDFSRMWNDPSRNDWAGIDTQVRFPKPKGFTKQKGKKIFDDIERTFGKSGFK